MKETSVGNDIHNTARIYAVRVVSKRNFTHSERSMICPIVLPVVHGN